MSAIADGDHEPIQVLFTLHPGFDTMDLVGPLEVLHTALHNPKDKCELPLSIQPLHSCCSSVPTTPPKPHSIQ